MNPIVQGTTGSAVEDIQERLTKLGYVIDQAELDSNTFGETTAMAVAQFRLSQKLPLTNEVDDACWAALVDASYELGDRTLYLRLPNFHGSDVHTLQTRLNILGFSCGEPDGCFGAYTESALKEFQESVGIMPDGMAFMDTFDAIARLKHVWDGNPAKGPHPTGAMNFSRAAHALESTPLALTGEDQICRNIIGRMVNLANATTVDSQLYLADDPECPENCTVVVLGTERLPKNNTQLNVIVDDYDYLPMRIRTAFESAVEDTPHIRLEVPYEISEENTFTVADAQALAVVVLDSLCMALEQM